MLTIYLNNNTIKQYEIGQPNRFHIDDLLSVKFILADGKELRKIEIMFTPKFTDLHTVPLTNEDQMIWTGDIAKTILLNFFHIGIILKKML